MIYLDNAATTQVRREVLEAMWPYLTGEFGNPSSSHSLGAQAATALKAARATVAECLNCRASEIIFTCGGTEADNLAIKGIALANPRGRHVIISAIEHEAVVESCDYLRRYHGFEITSVPVDHFGRVDDAQFQAALRHDTTLISVMTANNEVGTVEPIADLVPIAGKYGAVPFHTDAVQAAGALAIDVNALGVDALSLSGHKLGAPKGIGALFLRGRLRAEPLLHGGGQERGRRSGTENVAAAVGLAKALQLASNGLAQRMHTLTTIRDELIRGVLQAVPSAVLTGHPTQRLPGNASFVFPGVSGEALLLQLEERGVLCSSGSACAAGRDEPSPVLLALGFAPEVAQTAVRLTLPDAVIQAMVPHLVASIQAAHAALRPGA